MRVSAIVEEEEIRCFDQHWDALEDRKFQAIYTDTFPPGFRIDGGKRARLDK